ncbi:hypothetical protein Cyrtocomes_00706 [Candidatus Cyrtobacter comes]|uniref:Uncharacterized protein n=1 Tax=Candidatus Cyrtobacter comes TaxID=675776 RepID=A0ABU5L875_9RICK|nr:hypothetical protein [Candidatus Cyrtobacter comes]MDZ5762327.1 hypothetical protein [Candidatus Cyrtobacter comes]
MVTVADLQQIPNHQNDTLDIGTFTALTTYLDYAIKSKRFYSAALRVISKDNGDKIIAISLVQLRPDIGEADFYQSSEQNTVC